MYTCIYVYVHAWTNSTALKKHNHSSAGRYIVLSTVISVNFAMMPQNAYATYFAGIMPVASRYRLCQLLCRQIRLKLNMHTYIIDWMHMAL